LLVFIQDDPAPCQSSFHHFQFSVIFFLPVSCQHTLCSMAIYSI
jgi:hypothetical protein